MGVGLLVRAGRALRGRNRAAAALRHGIAVGAERGLDRAAALTLRVTHITGLADARAAFAAELVRSGLALRPLGLLAVLCWDLRRGGSRIVGSLAVEARSGRWEGHDRGIFELAMFAVGNGDRHLELDARTLGEIEIRVGALVVGTAADAAPRGREGDGVRRKAELLAQLDRAFIGIGPHIGDRHHIVAAIAVSGDLAVALRRLGRLEVGRVAGDERGAVEQEPLQEGIGLGCVGVVAGEEVRVRPYGRGEGEGIRHGAAGGLERRERRRDRHRHGERAVDRDGNGCGRVASDRRPSDAQPSSGEGRQACRGRNGVGEAQITEERRGAVVDDRDLVVAADEVAGQLVALAGIERRLLHAEIAERRGCADRDPGAARHVGGDSGRERQNRRRKPRGRDRKTVLCPIGGGHGRHGDGDGDLLLFAWRERERRRAREPDRRRNGHAGERREDGRDRSADRGAVGQEHVVGQLHVTAEGQRAGISDGHVEGAVGAGIASGRRCLGHGDIGSTFVAGDVEPGRLKLGAIQEAEIAGAEERAGVEHDLDPASLAGEKRAGRQAAPEIGRRRRRTNPIGSVGGDGVDNGRAARAGPAQNRCGIPQMDCVRQSRADIGHRDRAANLVTENAGITFLVDIDAGLGKVGRRIGRIGRVIGRERQRRGFGYGPLVARIEDGDVADIAGDVAVDEEAVIVHVPGLEGRHVRRAHLALIVALQPMDDARAALIDAVGLLALAQMLAGGPERHPALVVVDVAVLVVAVVERDAAFGRTMRRLQSNRVFLGFGRPAPLGFVPHKAQHR